MPFKGFKNLVYPEYDVITPQTLQTFTVRTMTVQDEERLKSSLKVPGKLVELLNKTIWNCIVAKPDYIKDFKSFTKNITLKDRDALLYGLYHITYEDIRNYDLTCGSCSREFSITVRASDTFSIRAYDKGDMTKGFEGAGMSILQKRVTFPLKMAPSVQVTIKQPTVYDEEEAFKIYSLPDRSNDDLLTETLIIDKIVEISETGASEEYTDRGDIIDAYSALVSVDRRIIYKKYMEEFGQYGIELKTRAKCTNCGVVQDVNLDLVTQFFRMVLATEELPRRISEDTE